MTQPQTPQGIQAMFNHEELGLLEKLVTAALRRDQHNLQPGDLNALGIKLDRLLTPTPPVRKINVLLPDETIGQDIRRVLTEDASATTEALTKRLANVHPGNVHGAVKGMLKSNSLQQDAGGSLTLKPG